MKQRQRRFVHGAVIALALGFLLLESSVTGAAAQSPLSAVDAPNQFVDVAGRRLAYRSIGSGTPIVLCTRFRGTMDDWDPAFLDALAFKGFRVIAFDYSGLGLSTGTRSYNFDSMANDAKDLADALGLPKIVIGGWSIGGLVAQVVIARFPERLTHAVLIGSAPAGKHAKAGDPLFLATAVKPTYGLNEETILFFEPASAESRDAARRSVDRIAARTHDRSRPVPPDWAAAALKTIVLPGDDVLGAIKTTTIPILHIGGDHDISLPVENWYALNSELPTVQLLTFPRSGHGPQHQFPEVVAEHIQTFVRTTVRP